MAFDSAPFEDFKVIIWMGQTLTFGWVFAMVTVHHVAMVTMVIHTYSFRRVDPVLLVHKSTQSLKILINVHF